MDEIETEGTDWTKLADLVTGNLAGWWQVTLDFLGIVTENWPKLLEERNRSNPAAHRNALIRLEAARLKRNPPTGPVIAAGSTGSIPATAELLAVIAGLPSGAVVLPGLDLMLDEPSFAGNCGARRAPGPAWPPAIRPGKTDRQDRRAARRCRGDRRCRKAARAARRTCRRGAAAGGDHRAVGRDARPLYEPAISPRPSPT